MQEKTYVHFIFSRGELVVDWDKKTLEFSLHSLLYWKGWQIVIPFNNVTAVNARSVINLVLPSKNPPLISDRKYMHEFSRYWMEIKYLDGDEGKTMNFSPGGKYFRNALLVDEWVKKLQFVAKDHKGPIGTVTDGFREQSKILRKVSLIFLLILLFVPVVLVVAVTVGPLLVVLFEKLLSLG